MDAGTLARNQIRLHKAAKSGKFREVLELLNLGSRAEEVDDDGWSAFGRAASAGQAEICRLFLKRGTDANLRGTGGVTALHEAAMKGHARVVKILLRYGANPHQKSDYDMTPMDKAKSSVMDLLTADPKIFDSPTKRGHVHFEKKEKVLCEQDSHIYEAVVMDTKLDKGVTVYKIHFQGWKSQHDLWMPLDKVLQLNEENLIRMDEVYAEIPPQEEEVVEVSRKSKRGGKVLKKKATKKAKTFEPEPAEVPTPEIKEVKEPPSESRRAPPKPSVIQIIPIKLGAVEIMLTGTLHEQLMYDCEMIQSKKLLQVPRSPSVEDIIQSFKKTNPLAPGSEQPYAEAEFYGFTELFNRALGMFLLYRWERPQYAMLRNSANDVPPAQIYGGEHLLRMFVKLPELLISSGVHLPSNTEATSELDKIVSFVQALVIHVDATSETVFNTDYSNPNDDFAAQF